MSTADAESTTIFLLAARTTTAELTWFTFAVGASSTSAETIWSTTAAAASMTSGETSTTSASDARTAGWSLLGRLYRPLHAEVHQAA